MSQNTLRTAFFHDTNIIALSACIATSAALLNPLPLIIGIVAETAYLLFAPPSSQFAQPTHDQASTPQSTSVAKRPFVLNFNSKHALSLESSVTQNTTPFEVRNTSEEVAASLVSIDNETSIPRVAPYIPY